MRWMDWSSLETLGTHTRTQTTWIFLSEKTLVSMRWLAMFITMVSYLA